MGKQAVKPEPKAGAKPEIKEPRPSEGPPEVESIGPPVNDGRPASSLPRCAKENRGYEWTDPMRRVWQIPEQCTLPVGHEGACAFAPRKDLMWVTRYWSDADEEWKKA